MRKGTTRALLWLIGVLFLGGIAGCGADEQTTLIAQTSAKLKETTGKFGELKGFAKKLVDGSKASGAISLDEQKAGKDQVAENLATLTQANETAKELRRLGEIVQRLKEYTDRAKEKTTPAYSKELLARTANSLRSELIELRKEEDGLNALLAQADGLAEGSAKQKLNELKDEIKHGTDAFDLLNKQR